MSFPTPPASQLPLPAPPVVREGEHPRGDSAPHVPYHHRRNGRTFTEAVGAVVVTPPTRVDVRGDVTVEGSAPTAAAPQTSPTNEPSQPQKRHTTPCSFTVMQDTASSDMSASPSYTTPAFSATRKHAEPSNQRQFVADLLQRAQIVLDRCILEQKNKSKSVDCRPVFN